MHGRRQGKTGHGPPNKTKFVYYPLNHAMDFLLDHLGLASVHVTIKKLLHAEFSGAL
jgi:hypothetical protein